MNILYEIQQHYMIFSEKEKQLADYILGNTGDIKNINIKDLAKRVGISESTITRFCKKIDCENFVDLKLKINGALGPNQKEKETENEGFSDIYYFYKDAIERTNASVNKSSIIDLVKAIKIAKKIYIYGVGSSGLSASELMIRLIRMGFNVHSITDSHMMIINSSIVSEEDLVIGISISGETNEVYKALEIAQKNKAKVVVITSFESSRIAKLAQEPFIIPNSKFINKEMFVNSQFSVIYLIDLISTVLLQDKELNQKMQITIQTIIG